MALLEFWSRTAGHLSCPKRGSPTKREDTATVEEVFYAYIPQVYHIARRMLGNEADAEDVTQEVLLRILCKLDSFRGEGQLTAWLHRVTVNTVVEHQRKSLRRRAREKGASLAAQLRRTSGLVADPPQQLLADERRELIEQAIARLPEMYREVYVLADVEELSNAAIGEILHLGVAAVKSRLHRARSMMREALAEHI